MYVGQTDKKNFVARRNQKMAGGDSYGTTNDAH